MPGLTRMREAQRDGKSAVGAGVPNGVVRCREKKTRGGGKLGEPGREEKRGAGCVASGEAVVS